jgi:hypothetical protein
MARKSSYAVFPDWRLAIDLLYIENKYGGEPGAFFQVIALRFYGQPAEMAIAS